MNSILFNLSGKIEKPLVDAFYALKDVADSLDISFFVVGASARDLILKHCYGIEPLRKTGDIDLGVQVANWEQFKELTESLITTGRFSPTKDTQRFLCGLILIDIVPFGPITGDDKRISWPPEHKIMMSMVGFEEAYKYSVTVRLSSDPELDIKVSTLSGLAIMKLISWKENHPERKRDAGDLLLIMNKYEEAGNSERLYGEELPLLLEEDFDARMAGIRLLGRDMAKICAAQTLRIIKSTLDAEIDDQGQFKLISHMMRESSMPEARFDEILIRLEKLRQGIVEVGEKSLE